MTEAFSFCDSVGLQTWWNRPKHWQLYEKCVIITSFDIQQHTLNMTGGVDEGLAHVIGMWWYVIHWSGGCFFLSAPRSREDGTLSHQDSTWQPAGLKWKLSQSWGPGLLSSGFYSLCPVQWNLTCFRGELNYGPINKYHISPFEVAYAMESGKMSCVKVITQFLRTNLLCLMFLTIEDCCGFIYFDSSQTEHFFHFARVSELFSISLRLYITPAEVT